MTIGELKALIKDLPNNLKVLITSDEEWNKVRECDGFNLEDYRWSSDERELYDVEDLEEDELEEFESCLILC